MPIKLAVFDFDGVFTDGRFYFGNEQLPQKSYNGKDSFGLKKLTEQGILVGVITNDASVSLENTAHIRCRLKYLSASSSQDKLEVLTQWKEELGFQWNEIAYMGDDEPDLPCLESVGLSAAPCDAREPVLKICDFISEERGGHGAVRSFCEHILQNHNSLQSACICIPARLKSSRLPSKLLLDIDGVCIIRRTCLQAKKTDLPVFLFTDSDQIARVVDDIVDDVFVTTEHYENGTERLSRNEFRIPHEFDTVINVQGDEPFIDPRNILHALEMHKMRTPNTFYTTLHEKCDVNEAKDPARVKVAVSHNRAHWYSRSVIPYFRVGAPEVNIFTGIYVFQRDMLRKFSALPDTPCQRAESIEQLKVLEHGFHIASFATAVKSAPSIDTAQDYAKFTSKQAVITSRLLDCTLRDGGYINNWLFSDSFVSNFFPVVSKIVDIIEVGFINLPEAYRSCPVGKFRNLNRFDLHQLRALFDRSLAVMADLNAINRQVVFPRNPDVDMVRIAFNKSDVSRAKMLAEELLDCGYEVCLNFMSSHTYTPEEIAQHAADVPGAIPYVVDSLGCMHSKQVQHYVAKLPLKCGLHLHNNLQQAVGTYQSVKCGITDATIFGIGRGAGNLPLELCNISTKDRSNILRFFDCHMRNIPRSWGYKPEFVLQAHLNCHPNYVIKLMDMGIDTSYISRVLHQLKNASKFDLEKLNALFLSIDEST